MKRTAIAFPHTLIKLWFLPPSQPRLFLRLVILVRSLGQPFTAKQRASEGKRCHEGQCDQLRWESTSRGSHRLPFSGSSLCFSFSAFVIIIIIYLFWDMWTGLTLNYWFSFLSFGSTRIMAYSRYFSLKRTYSMEIEMVSHLSKCICRQNLNHSTLELQSQVSEAISFSILLLFLYLYISYEIM